MHGNYSEKMSLQLKYMHVKTNKIRHLKLR